MSPKKLFFFLFIWLLVACTPTQTEDPAKFITVAPHPTETIPPLPELAATPTDFDQPLPPTTISDFPNPMPSLTPVPAVILNWRPNPSLPADLYQAITEQFNREPAGYGLVYQAESDPTSYSQKLLVEIAAGIGPDVFWLPAESLAQFANQGLLLNLQAMAENDDLGAFYPGPMAHLTFDPNQQNKVLWGVPADVDSLAIYLNLDLLAAANAPDPRQLATAGQWNWDRFGEVAQAVNDPAGAIYGYEQPWLWWSYGMWANAAGGGLLTADGSCGLTDPAGLVGFDFVQQLYQEQQVAVPYGQDSSHFLQGQAGMMLYHHGLMPFMEEATFNWDVVELPAGPVNNGNWLFWGAYVVNAYTRHPQEAWHLLKSLTSTTIQAQLSQSGFMLSGRTDIPTTPQDQIFLNGLDKATVVAPNWNNGLEYTDFSCSAATQLLSGEMSLTDFATNACNQFNQATITICP